MGTNLRDGNVDRMGIVAITINPGAVSANTTSQQSFTVPGLRVGDYVVTAPPSYTAGFIVATSRVTTDDTLTIEFANITGSSIDVSSRVYTFIWFRPSRGESLPSAVVV